MTPATEPIMPIATISDPQALIGRPAFVSADAAQLDASPQPLYFDPGQTALIVVDMQNAYASKDGYMDRAGFDIAHTAAAVAGVQRALASCRAAGMTIVYLQNGWDARYVEAGGPGSPNWHKSNAIRTMRAQPELEGRLLSKGGWDYALLESVRPQEQDIVVAKTRYSGFFNSTLDGLLRARGIRTLLFSGIATNVCVESSLRDAYHLEYFCVLLEDACAQAGPAAMQAATRYNVETFFGWISSTAQLAGALSPSHQTATHPSPAPHR